MKKYLSILLSVILLVSSISFVSAAVGDEIYLSPKSGASFVEKVAAAYTGSAWDSQSGWGHFIGGADNYVSYTVTTEYEGLYDVYVGYAAPENFSYMLSVNGVVLAQKDFAGTGTYDTGIKEEFFATVKLNSGENKVAVEGVTGVYTNCHHIRLVEREYNVATALGGTIYQVRNAVAPDHTISYEYAVKDYSTPLRERALIGTNNYFKLSLDVEFSGTYDVVGLFEAYNSASEGKIEIYNSNFQAEPMAVSLSDAYPGLEWEKPLRNFGTVELAAGRYTLKYSVQSATYVCFQSVALIPKEIDYENVPLKTIELNPKNGASYVEKVAADYTGSGWTPTSGWGHFLGGHSNYVSYTFNARTSGFYDVYVGYGSVEDFSYILSVNGVAVAQKEFTATGSHERPTEVKFDTVKLNNGVNTIAIESVTGVYTSCHHIKLVETKDVAVAAVGGTFNEVKSNPVPDYTVDYANAVAPYGNGVRPRALLSKDTHITFPVKINFTGTYKIVGLVEAFSTAATGKISLIKGSTRKEIAVNLDTPYGALDGSATSAWEQPLKTLGTIDLEKGDYTLRYSDVSANFTCFQSLALVPVDVNTGVYSIENVAIKADDKVTSAFLNGTKKVSLTADISHGAAAPYAVYLAVYSENGKRLEKIVATDGKTKEGGEATDIDLYIDKLDLNESHRVKAFFFKGYTDLTPLRAPEVLSPAGF